MPLTPKTPEFGLVAKFGVAPSKIIAPGMFGKPTGVISYCVIRREPLAVAASDVTIYTGSLLSGETSAVRASASQIQCDACVLALKRFETQTALKAFLAGSCGAVTMRDEYWAYRILPID